MKAHISLTIAVWGSVCGADVALAQRITVQQPVVTNFSVGTTVVVPDRGGVLLGAVKRAGDISRQAGLLGLAGRSRSSFRDHSGVSAHVWIHDFDAMDRYLLNQPTGGADGDAGLLLGANAVGAYEALLARNRYKRLTTSPIEAPYRERSSLASRGLSPATTRPTMPSPPAAPAIRSASDRADAYFRMGSQAEADGAVERARIHYRLAARYGSEAAAKQLHRLDASVSTQPAELAANE